MGRLAEVWERSSHLQEERKLFPIFIKNEIERIIYVLRDVLEMLLLKLYGVVAEQGLPKDEVHVRIPGTWGYVTFQGIGTWQMWFR